MSFPSDNEISIEVSLCKPASEAKDLGYAKQDYFPISVYELSIQASFNSSYIEDAFSGINCQV